MRTIYVLDQYTNGHEAALSFIRRQKWKKKECNIVFCGTHAKLLRNLAENPGYGVVPVMNTIRGEVTSVTAKISELCDQGYTFEITDVYHLQIEYCLLVHKCFRSGQTLTRVISKPEALSQCNRWLKRHGITSAKRGVSNSTSAAARRISLLKSGASKRIGAIAPVSAAIAYNLRILAKNIADDSKNVTTFHLLYNPWISE